MTATLKVWHKIRLHQSMHIYMKNNPSKCHSDPIWNNGALGFFEEVSPTWTTTTTTTTRWLVICDQFLSQKLDFLLCWRKFSIKSGHFSFNCRSCKLFSTFARMLKDRTVWHCLLHLDPAISRLWFACDTWRYVNLIDWLIFCVTIRTRVTTYLENLRKSGNSKVVRENGKSQGKVRGSEIRCVV